jgi:hypothetical protein
MERIRKFGNKYQVLITPHQDFNNSMEIMLGGWDTEDLRDYEIRTYDSMNQAQCIAFRHPPIDWNKLVSIHKDAFYDIDIILKDIIAKQKYIVEYEKKIMTGDEVKNIMFNRVITSGKRFNLSYNLNDVIGFHIINPWTKNLWEISEKLSNIPQLQIKKKFMNDGIIKLIGLTDFGTTYEITLWPTLLSNWARWIYKHPNLLPQTKKDSYKQIKVLQQLTDNSITIR